MAEETNAESIETFQGEDGQYYFHAKSANGEILDTSEGYTRHEDAVRAAEGLFPGVQISASTVVNEQTGDEDDSAA